MAARPEFIQETWYYSREQIENSPSRKYGLDQDKELSYRQQAANLIQDMGQRLTVNQLCINTGIVYMHRFYMVHSFTKFHRNVIAPACLFLGAKVEEQPRKLEHVVRVAYACLNRETQQQLNPKSEQYSQLAQELVINESIILQTLGFEIAVDHPHTHVVKCTQLIRASKDLSQTSYFMATNSLHLTTFCLRYKPTAVACACIYLSAKWSKLQIPKSSDGKDFWEYVDKNLTSTIIEEITREFIQIIESSPNRLKRKLALKQGQSDTEIKNKLNEQASTSSSSASIFDEDEPSDSSKVDAQHPKDQTDGNKSNVVSSKSSLNLTEYKMMKEKEIKREKEKARQRELQKVDEQHSNHNRLPEHGKQKDPNIRSEHHGKHTESRPNDGQVKQRESHSSRTMNDQVKQREGHRSMNEQIKQREGHRPMNEQVKHGDNKLSSLHTPEKFSDSSSYRSQGHGDAHRTQDRSRSHHAHKPQSHPPVISERAQSIIKPSNKDVRPPDHKKDVRHRHHHAEKKSHDHQKNPRPVDELRLHTSDQRHRSEHRHLDGHEKVDMPKYRHLQENPAEAEEYILMKPDSLVEMDILGALKEECASPSIPSPHVPSPHVPNRHVPMSQSLSKVVKDQSKRDIPVERVPDHQSLLEESIQGLNKKEAVSQQNLSKDRRKRSIEQSKEAKVGKVKHEPVRSEQKGKPDQVKARPEQVKVKLEQVAVKSEPVTGRHEHEIPDHVKVRPDHIKVRPEQVTPRPVQEKPEPLTIRPEQPKVKPDQVKARSEQVLVKPEPSKGKPDQVKVRSDHVKARPEQVSVKLEPVMVKPEQTKVKPDQVKVKNDNVKVRSEQVTPKTEQFMMKSEHAMVKLESPRLKKEPKVHQDSIITASPVKFRKDVLQHDSLKLELPTSPAKVQKDVHNQVKLESPVKVRRDIINQDVVKPKSELLPSPAKIRKDTHSPGKSKKSRASSKPVMHETSTLDLSSIGIGNFLTNPEPVIKERNKTSPKVKRELLDRSIPMVKKETTVKLDFNSTPALQKIKSEPTMKPVAPPKKRIKNMMQTQSQPVDLDVQQLRVPPQQATPQQIQKSAPPEITSQLVLKQQTQQQPELSGFSNPEVESWSHMMHPAEIMNSNDFMNDMKHETTHLDDLSLGTGLFDFQTQSLNQSSVCSNLDLKDPEPKLIHKNTHPAEILENSVPAKKSKAVKKEPGISQLEFDPHPAEIFENVSIPKVKEPSEDGELVADDSLVHPTEIANPALLRVKNEEPVMLKASSLDQKEHSSDHERRSSDLHKHSDHKRHSKHKHSSKKKDKDRDRHRSKDRSSSRSREIKDHSSEIRHSSNGNEVGPSEPVSVLTTSEGIKLKIKLGNSFSEKQASPSAGNSPLSMKIDLKKMRDYDSKHDKERKKDKSSRHHKHKSHKRSHSPLESSTGDAPASPAKRRATNSLLNLPMPPADPKKKSKHSLSNGESPASNVYNFN